MKISHGRALVFVFFLFACQPTTSPTVTIIDNVSIITLQTEERIPSALLAQAGITLNPNDHILSNGLPIALDQSITSYPITLQLRRAVNLTLITPEGQKQIRSSAFTVGEALAEASYWLHAGDKIDPPLNSPISSSPISIFPSAN